MTREQRLLIMQSFQTMKEEVDFLSDSLLMDICEQWIISGSKLPFEGFMDWYLENDFDA